MGSSGPVDFVGMQIEENENKQDRPTQPTPPPPNPPHPHPPPPRLSSFGQPVSPSAGRPEAEF